MKKNAGTTNLLQLLLGLLLIPVATAYTLVTVDTYKWLTETIGYKLLWTILIFLLLTLIYTVIYFRFNSKPHLIEEKNNVFIGSQMEFNEKEIQHQLKNLPQKEKEYLKKFLDSDKSILEFPRTDQIAHSLELKGILENVSEPESFHPTYSYKISDVYWNYLKKNPKVLKT